MGNLQSVDLDPRARAAAAPGADAPASDDLVGARMRASLEVLVRLIERVQPGMRGSVLLLDDDGVTLRHGAAPNLPAEYCRLIDGEKIGPATGSCGTAAYRGEQVIVRDIATDPLWATYKQAALPFGLAACWSTPILDPDGRVLGTFAMYYDEPRSPSPVDIELTRTAAHLAMGIIAEARAVTALRTQQALLRSSRERLRAALDASSTSTFRWDMQTGIVDGDDGLFRLFGVDPAEAAGSFDAFVARIHPEDRDRVIAGATRCATEGADLDEEFRIVRPDGSLRWAVDKGKIVLGDDGRPAYLIGACVDVTEHRTEMQLAELARDRALVEARRERERLYDVFRQAPAAIAVVEGPEHRFTVSNARYRKLIGDRDVVGMTFLDALPELRGQGFVELLDQVRASARPVAMRDTVARFDRDDDGVTDDCFVDYVYQPLEDADGGVFGVLILAVDVTIQVMSRLEIAAARAEAERANKAKSAFLAGMSHDLRTPLSAIGGFADLTADGIYGEVNDAQRHAMSRIRRAGDHLLTLINDILTFAKIEAGRVHLEVEEVDVGDVVAGAIAMIEVQATKRGLAVAAEPADDVVHAIADRERTTQILINLLTNAVKFTETGSVTVAWRADAQHAHLDVRDTGRGIPADKLASIFEAFVQAGRSQEEQQQGVGLGLAISRELARAMDGDLTVASAVGQGSTFTLSLPRAPEA